MLMRARLVMGGLVGGLALSLAAGCSSDVTQANSATGTGVGTTGSGPTTSSTTGSSSDTSTSATGTTTGGQGGQGGAGGADMTGAGGDGGSNASDGGPSGSAGGSDGAAPPIDAGPSAIAGKKGLWDFPGLLRIRTQASSGALKPAYDQIIAQAEASMTVGPFSVVNKTTTPPSGDKHDYMGMGRYYWPDPNNPTGSYISRDGESNPDVDSNKYDYHAMFTMSGSVTTLGLAYFLSRDEKYAQKAHDLLKVWYIDAATKMNPNLNYAQSIPQSTTTGRKEGIIDTLQMAYMIDGVEMLRDSPAFNAADFTALTAWFTSFVDWLRTSTFGKGEEAATNNHGSWYDVQTMRYAIFLGNNTLAMQLAELAKTRRIATQVNPDGSLPQEIARTNSLFYSEYDLSALFGIAQLAADVGVDIYGFQTADARSVRKALDFLAPYADATKVWPYPQIIMDDRTLLMPLLRRAGIAYNAPAYEQTLQMYFAAMLPSHIAQIVYPK